MVWLEVSKPARMKAPISGSSASLGRGLSKGGQGGEPVGGVKGAGGRGRVFGSGVCARAQVNGAPGAVRWVVEAARARSTPGGLVTTLL